MRVGLAAIKGVGEAIMQQMVDERAQARKEKNWKRSDELRDAIKAAGYVLEDTPQGQKVRRSV